MITFLILPLSRPLRASTSRLAPILPRRLADHHLRPYPMPPPYSTTLPMPLPTLYPTTARPLSYHYPQTALGASSTPTYPYLSH